MVFSGKNNQGFTTIRNRNRGLKKSILNIDNFRKYNNKLSLCIQINKISNLTCLNALLKYSDGTFSYILSSHGLKPGMYTYTSIRPPKFSLPYNTGCNIILRYLNYNSIFFNLEIKINKGGKYSKSAGTFCKLINLNFNTNFAKIVLPTGKIKLVSVFCFVTLGRASNIFYKNQFFSKAGYYRNLGFKPSVRGVAMNPIDHPHGGRTKSNSPEVTP